MLDNQFRQFTSPAMSPEDQLLIAGANGLLYSLLYGLLYGWVGLKFYQSYRTRSSNPKGEPAGWSKQEAPTNQNESGHFEGWTADEVNHYNVASKTPPHTTDIEGYQEPFTVRRTYRDVRSVYPTSDPLIDTSRINPDGLIEGGVFQDSWHDLVF